MLKHLESTLLQKAKTNKLHNLYLVEPNDNDPDRLTLQWSKKLVSSFIVECSPGKSLENHPDILILKALEDQKTYNMDNIEQIFQFLHYKAQETNRKFIIIEDATKLSITHVNKLLKVFEEPPIELTFILVNSSRKQLLATLCSRSIKLRVPLIEKQNSSKMEIDLSELSFIQFMQLVNKNNWEQTQLVAYLYDKLSTSKLDLSLVQRIQDTLKALEDDATFHNSKQGQFFKIYSCLSEITSS